jgi:hypothetical protein
MKKLPDYKLFHEFGMSIPEIIKDFLKTVFCRKPIPLIYTKYGNVPLASVRMVSTFDDNTEIKIGFDVADTKMCENAILSLIPTFEKTGSITVHNRYYDIETNELVKEESVVLVMGGLATLTDTGEFN